MRGTGFLLLWATMGLGWLGCEHAIESVPPVKTKADVRFDHGHPGLAKVLLATVDDLGLVDYPALRQQAGALDAYLKNTAEVPRAQFDSWARPERMAFLLNVYNAATLKLMADQTVDSIKDIGGLVPVWKLQVVRLFGGKYSLDDVEHQMLRGQFESPAIHFALVCGARSCPPLRREPYTAHRLEAQFAEQARLFLRDADKNRVDVPAKILYLSPIFKWFRSDFGKDDAEIIALVSAQFTKEEREALLEGVFEIRYTEYDWGRNQSEARPEN